MSCVLANAKEWSLGRVSRLTLVYRDMQNRLERRFRAQREVAHLQGRSAGKSSYVLTHENSHAV